MCKLLRAGHPPLPLFSLLVLLSELTAHLSERPGCLYSSQVGLLSPVPVQVLWGPSQPVNAT